MSPASRASQLRVHGKFLKRKDSISERTTEIETQIAIKHTHTHTKPAPPRGTQTNKQTHKSHV